MNLRSIITLAAALTAFGAFCVPAQAAPPAHVCDKFAERGKQSKHCDITAPVISGASDLTVQAADAAGAPVSFALTAVDDRDGAVPVTCSHPSGSLFAVGATQVSCTATDSSGNEASASFTVTVLAPVPVRDWRYINTAFSSGPGQITITGADLTSVWPTPYVILYKATGGYVLYHIQGPNAGFYSSCCGSAGSEINWGADTIVIDHTQMSGTTFVKLQLHTPNGLVEERDIVDFTVA